MPVIDRPFEDAEWFNAITWPFKRWQASRFSDGAYGVWYGSDSVETTVYESIYHWYKSLLCDAGFDSHAVIAERKVYQLASAAALLDFRAACTEYSEYSDLLHPTDYSFCQVVGARVLTGAPRSFDAVGSLAYWRKRGDIQPGHVVQP